MAPKAKQEDANAYPPITADRAFKPRWYTFPDELPSGEFRGFECRKDPTMVRGAFVLGQNIKFRDAAQPTLREGFDPIGTQLTNATPVDRAWVFETRSGVIFLLKAYNGGLYYYINDVSSDFSLLKSGFTAGHEFGFANLGESSGEFHTWFDNGVDPWYQFNGAYATVLSTTINTITMSESGTFASRGFYSSGTRSVIVNGVEATYSGGEGTATLTGVSTTVGMNPGDLIVQSPRLPTWRIFLPFLTVPASAFVVGETVTGGTSGATATVQRVAPDKTYIVVVPIAGTFVANETLTGGTSGATAPLVSSIDTRLGPPLASIIFAHLGRIHCWSATRQSVWDYSMLDDPYTWTVFGLDTSGGSKDVEFGGPGTGFGRLNQAIIGYKRRSITSLNFVQTGQKTDVPIYTPLIQADDKGTTLGAINQRSTFSSPYGMISVTDDSKMILLKAMSQNGQPDYDIISDPIQPVFSMANLDDGTGICVDGVLWYAFKADANSGANDTYLTGDLRRQSFDNYGKLIPIRWDVPGIGWQVHDWTAVPSQTSGSKVQWHSSLNSNSYVENTIDKVDNGGGFTAIVRTWSETFGSAQSRKRADRAFVEILLRDNSVVNAALLLDENGYTGRIERVMRGSDTGKRFGSESFNPFGATTFGSERIGSNGAIDDRKRYRFYFELKETLWFFNLALSLEADTENSDFELIRFGIHIVDQEIYTPKALSI